MPWDSARMGLRWDWGLYHGGSAPWQGCSRPQLTARRAQDSWLIPPATIRPPQGGSSASHRCPVSLWVQMFSAPSPRKGYLSWQPRWSGPSLGDMEGKGLEV